MLFYNTVPDEDFKNYLLLKDYVIKKTELRNINGQSYTITSFEGGHDTEYTISETINGEVSGRVQLLKRGIIQLSWVIKNGERTGCVSIYDDGTLAYVFSWDYFLLGKNLRVVMNSGQQSYLTIIDAETHKAIYRGQYDPETLARNGKGIEYDRKTGDEKYVGVFRDDKLTHISIEFLGNNRLIQYEENERCNLDMFERLPIYKGEYQKVDCMQFDLIGPGKHYNPYTGMGNGTAVEYKEPSSIVEHSSLLSSFLYRETSLREMIIPFAIEEYSVENKRDLNLENLNIHYTHLSLTDTILRTGDFSLFECVQCVHLNNVRGGGVLRFLSLMRLKTIRMQTSFYASLKIVNCPQLNNLILCKDSTEYQSSPSSLIINGMGLLGFSL